LLQKIKILVELTKLKITVFVTVTTMFGYVAAINVIDSRLIYTAIGLLLLACGSAVLNHYQERYTDALMDRTKNRPIPSGKISAINALKISVILVLVGTITIYLSSNMMAAILGLLNLIWYNGIYTPLKKRTPLAIIPGSLVGAIPPMVGWTAAGGVIYDPQIIIIAFFFFIWQIPHFWLLLLILDKDYQQAGFPTLTQVFSKDQLARITFVWITATAVTGLLLPFFKIVQNPFINFSLLFAVIWLTFNSMKLIKQTHENKLAGLPIRFAFRDINYFALFVVIIISIDKLFVS
jgi:protoheme IX farnesyltransferase